MKIKTNILVIVISLILGGGIYFGNQFYQNYLNQKTDTIILKNATLDSIDWSSNKINIYVFWGDGCPHCEELFDFLESIRRNYRKYFNVYGFEVWYHEENGKIMDNVKEELGEQSGSRAVPYFIIGDQQISGFDDSTKKEIKDLITSKYKNKKDIKQLKSLKNRTNF